MKRQVKYGNSVIVYDLIKSKRRKTSQIIVSTKGITVRTPQNKSYIEIKKMIQQKAQWIYKKQLEFADKKKYSFSLKYGLLVLGKHYKIDVIPNSPTTNTRLIGDAIEFYIPQKRHTVKQIKIQYQVYLEKRANLLFPKIVHEMSNQMDVIFAKTNIKLLQDRWGSATQKGEINLNYNLMIAPKQVIKYVILHELCHLKIKEHSSKFWQMISKYMPDYKTQTKWLEENATRII